MSLKILILGANGFIGSNLSEYILQTRPDWEIFAMDVKTDKLGDNLLHPRFHFVEGDITINKEWVEYHIKKCDVVLPLVAIATPATYVKDPLAVFELDFEANLAIVRHCVRYHKRVVFPSTSEVYGMSTDSPYDEEESTLVTGPIQKERWIYSASKQLMDRVIYAYGHHHGLPFTLFRPFNWVGPKLDNPWESKEGSSRVVTQFISAILHRQPIHLVDGGKQKRCFLYVDDAIEALVRIIENKDGCADGRIFNIGHPGNEASVAELAELLLEVIGDYPGYENIRDEVKLQAVKGEEYYGKGYQDLVTRVPMIRNAQTHLHWSPTTDLRTALTRTVEYYLQTRPQTQGKKGTLSAAA
ncbi:MAG: bifunctional UDP-4-keto-pentose/UDP-xylose synthase [Alphaproteobacteria bacterium]|nr:bifunctional UDP-4-keto-pentose/UDP-xylose synthase [Alphaproteobacteria bacterium]